MITVVYFWSIRPRHIPFAIIRMAMDRFALRKEESISFYKLVGCGRGENFMPQDADPLRWGVIVCMPESDLSAFDTSTTITRWQKHSFNEFRVVLECVNVHGKWSGVQPFNPSVTQRLAPSSKLGVAAITRAKIDWRHYPRFLRAIPSVNEEVQTAVGRIASFGIGEAPVGLQGTFSIWRTSEDLTNFAYRGSAHSNAINATEKFKWYSEELFARFNVIDIRGTL